MLEIFLVFTFFREYDWLPHPPRESPAPLSRLGLKTNYLSIYYGHSLALSSFRCPAHDAESEKVQPAAAVGPVLVHAFAALNAAHRAPGESAKATASRTTSARLLRDILRHTDHICLLAALGFGLSHLDLLADTRFCGRASLAGFFRGNLYFATTRCIRARRNICQTWRAKSTPVEI